MDSQSQSQSQSTPMSHALRVLTNLPVLLSENEDSETEDLEIQYSKTKKENLSSPSSLFRLSCVPIRDLYSFRDTSEIITIQVTILRYRQPFCDCYDGSEKTLQCVLPKDFKDSKDSKDFGVGCFVSFRGNVRGHFKIKDDIEFHVQTIEIIGKVPDPSTYLPCAKNVSLETLRGDKCHMRALFTKPKALLRIRDKALFLFYEFFKSFDFIKIDPNLLTSSDCEGGGEMFYVLTQKDIDIIKSCKDKEIPYKETFLKKNVGLQVSSQLSIEAFAKGFQGVYTDNPSFRADPSCSRRHLCEFKHIEVESRHFKNIQSLMDFEEDMIKYVIRGVLEMTEEYRILDVNSEIQTTLKRYISQRFVRISYSKAIDILHEHKFEIEWGDDLGSTCEKFLTEKVFKCPMFVYSFPRSLKSFYMKQTTETTEGKETMEGCDLLFPMLGELIGGSVRENDYDVLMSEVIRRQMDITPIQWYVDLRKSGSVPTGGFGLGFDRFVGLLCFIEPNIRDSAPIYTAYGECYY